MTFIWRTTAGATKYITIRQNQFLASNGKRAWLSLNVTFMRVLKKHLDFSPNQTTSHGKQSKGSTGTATAILTSFGEEPASGSSYFSKVCALSGKRLPNH